MPKMHLQLIGAGLPRTGTRSLRQALELLLGAPCCHMSALPGHPFALGAGWDQAIAGGPTDWDSLMAGYAAEVDWPASMFWRELSAANPRAPVLLSVRDSAEDWLQSFEATILPIARQAEASDWSEGRSLQALLVRFAGSPRWDDPALLTAAYLRHNAEVRQAIPAPRLIEWRAADGWAPICAALGLPVPESPFPWNNRRGEWHT